MTRNSATVSQNQIQPLVAKVRDFFPQHGKGFIEICLPYFDNDPGDLINALLENNLPPHLSKLTKLEMRMTETQSSNVEENSVEKKSSDEVGLNINVEEKLEDIPESSESQSNENIEPSDGVAAEASNSDILHEKKCKYCGKDFGKANAWRHFLKNHQKSCRSKSVKESVKSQKIEIANGNNSITPHFEIPKQKPMPKSIEFLTKEANCDRCKIRTRFSTESYNVGRLCFECMVEWVYSKDTRTDDENKIFGCDFCDEQYIRPDIYIHMDKKHYDNIIQSEIESTDEENLNHDEEGRLENEIVLPNSKFHLLANDDSREIFSDASNEKIIQPQIKIANDKYTPKNEHIEDKDLSITFIKQEYSLQSKTKITITINRRGGDKDVFAILIRKPPNSVTLADVKQHLMSNPERYNNFDGDLYEYDAKTNIGGIEGYKFCDEDEEAVATLPLLGDQIVLKCWYKS